MFAGSCIGVIFLGLSLEFLHRLAEEYDHFIGGQHSQHLASQDRNFDASEEPLNRCTAGDSKLSNEPSIERPCQARPKGGLAGSWNDQRHLASRPSMSLHSFRTTVWQRLAKAPLHVL